MRVAVGATVPHGFFVFNEACNCVFSHGPYDWRPALALFQLQARDFGATLRRYVTESRQIVWQSNGSLYYCVIEARDVPLPLVQRLIRFEGLLLQTCVGPDALALLDAQPYAQLGTSSRRSVAEQVLKAFRMLHARSFATLVHGVEWLGLNESLRGELAAGFAAAAQRTRVPPVCAYLFAGSKLAQVFGTAGAPVERLDPRSALVMLCCITAFLRPKRPKNVATALSSTSIAAGGVDANVGVSAGSGPGPAAAVAGNRGSSSAAAAAAALLHDPGAFSVGATAASAAPPQFVPVLYPVQLFLPYLQPAVGAAGAPGAPGASYAARQPSTVYLTSLTTSVSLAIVFPPGTAGEPVSPTLVSEFAEEFFANICGFVGFLDTKQETPLHALSFVPRHPSIIHFYGAVRPSGHIVVPSMSHWSEDVVKVSLDVASTSAPAAGARGVPPGSPLRGTSGQLARLPSAVGTPLSPPASPSAASDTYASASASASMSTSLSSSFAWTPQTALAAATSAAAAAAAAAGMGVGALGHSGSLAVPDGHFAGASAPPAAPASHTDAGAPVVHLQVRALPFTSDAMHQWQLFAFRLLLPFTVRTTVCVVRTRQTTVVYRQAFENERGTVQRVRRKQAEAAVAATLTPARFLGGGPSGGVSPGVFSPARGSLVVSAAAAPGGTLFSPASGGRDAVASASSRLPPSPASAPVDSAGARARPFSAALPPMSGARSVVRGLFASLSGAAAGAPAVAAPAPGLSAPSSASSMPVSPMSRTSSTLSASATASASAAAAATAASDVRAPFVAPGEAPLTGRTEDQSHLCRAGKLVPFVAMDPFEGDQLLRELFGRSERGMRSTEVCALFWQWPPTDQIERAVDDLRADFVSSMQ